MVDPSGSGRRDDRDDDEVTRQYIEQVRVLHREWAGLERRGDDSVQLSRDARAMLSDAVRAQARHGARVQMPPTDAGPYSMTELALRTLIRDAVDGTPGAMNLRTTVEYASARSGPAHWGARGRPRRVSCRISASATTAYLPALGDSAGAAVRAACARDLDLTDLVVDIHIEDLHEY